MDEVIGKASISTFVELGAHIGYSTLRFSRLLPASATYYSVDPEPMGHAVKMAYVVISVMVFSESAFVGSWLTPR